MSKTKWIWFGVFMGLAALLVRATTPATTGLTFVAKLLQSYLPMVEIMLLANFGFKDLVNTPKAGSIDSKALDRWSIVHGLAGVVMGLFGVAFPVVVGLTVLWEVFEMTVHGFGDTEVNSNRITDILVALGGWGFSRAIAHWH